MTLPRLAVVALTLLALSLAPAASAADPQGDAIKGVWSVASKSVDGRLVPVDPTAGPQLSAFDGKEYVRRQGLTITEEGSYVVDPTRTPATIDFVIKKGADAGKRQLGIYELEGDTLRVCLTEPGSKKRPGSFADKPNQLIVVARRYRP